MRRVPHLLGLCLMTLALGLSATANSSSVTLGTYGHPQPFWDAGGHLGEHGVNAVFIHGGSIDEATVTRARAEGCKVYAEFATLNGKYGDYVAEHPDAHPVDDMGEPARPATWFMGVCPTHSGFRAFRMQALRELLDKHDLDGVWMDYHHWHAQFEDPYPVFIKTCFNQSCLDAFQAWAKLTVPEGAVPERSKWIFMNAARQWEDWRVSVLVDWAREIHGIVKEMRPGALVGNYQVAWKDTDLAGVRRRCLGLDFEALAPYVDVFSPMIYHGRSGKTPDYVREYVDYFGANHLGEGKRLWPIVQAHDEPRIEPGEFEAVLRHALSGKSTGVMMFTLGSVAKDAQKMEVMKRVYQEYSKGDGL